MTEKTIEKDPYMYGDIRVGDKIRVTDTFPDGAVITITGVADHLFGSTWKTSGGIHLVSTRPVSEGVARKMELLNRPVMPVKIGTIINAVLRKDERQVLLVRVEQTSTFDELVWLELAGDGQQFHAEADIQGWTEMKLVEV